MSDLIRREDAIEAIRKRIETLSRDEQFVKKCGHIDLYGTIPLIRSIPSAQAWIPTSDRLPEKDGRYMVTFRDNVYFSPFEDGEWYIVGVTAWQEIPEPYREDGEHEVNRR